MTLRHDHGWEGCHRNKYFLKRAERVIRDSRENGSFGAPLPSSIIDSMKNAALDDAVDLRLADGGWVPASTSYLVGEHATDAADYLPNGFRIHGDLEARRQFDREEIARIFQVPLSLLSWSVKTDAQLKAERDALVRKTLWGKKPKYTLTAQ